MTRNLGRRAGFLTVTLVTGLVVTAPAQVIIYEGTSFPEEVAWQRLPPFQGNRKLADGWLIQTIEHGQDFYRYNIGGVSGLVDYFFVEWRAITDNPEWLIGEWQVPAVLSCGGVGPTFYHVVMTESAAVLLRDVIIPRVIAPFSLSEPHTYRVEVVADEYIWYIDGVMADIGIPEGPYPDPNAQVNWGAEVIHEDAPPAITAWDYVRAGRIPNDASGDYDSDAAVTLIDQYFVADCLTNDGPGIFGGPGNDAGPGCRFSDFDTDSDVDLLDIAEFQIRFNGQ